MMESILNIEMLQEGTLLHGNYRIEDYLASGGFGNTYRVLHVELGEYFAIKEFYMRGVSEREEDSTTVRVSNTQNRTQFTKQLRKFKKEALRLRKLNNPHIVRVHDLFEENGTAYYVMDLIDGISLSAHLKQTKKAMSEKEVWNILPQILQALDTVHTNGFQHLDLKPGNIMMDKHGNVTLIDFGASKQLDAEEGASTSSALAYTQGYAPREQMEQNLSKLGPWTDLYALGATLYNLLTNQKPPLPSDIDDEPEHAFDFPKHVSDRMRQLILWMMSSRRDRRPQSVAEVRKWLEDKETAVVEVMDDEQTVVEPPKSTPRPQPKQQPQPKPQAKPDPAPSSSKKWYVRYGIVIAVAIMTSAALTWWKMSDRTEVSQEEQTVEEIQPKTVTNQAYNNSYMGYYSYTGPVDDENLAHGKGKATLANGDTYEGDFVHGVFDGEATYTYKEGDVFKGKFSDNRFSSGTYTTVDGNRFIGSFKNGQPADGSWYDAKGNRL